MGCLDPDSLLHRLTRRPAADEAPGGNDRCDGPPEGDAPQRGTPSFVADLLNWQQAQGPHPDSRLPDGRLPQAGDAGLRIGPHTRTHTGTHTGTPAGSHAGPLAG